MAIIVTSKEFNQRASQVLKASQTEPVFITKWGKVVSVLSSYQDYQKQQANEPTFEELFANPATAPLVDNEFLEDFEQTLKEIRRNSKLRSVDFD